ncbi:MAG: SH3 domain-containing protein [Brevinematales bacterium]|jgi:hypothetical protein
MNKIIFVYIIACLLTAGNIFSRVDNNITDNSLVVLGSNVIIYRDNSKGSKQVSSAIIPDVFRFVSGRIVSGRIEIEYTNNTYGWIGVENTSFIKNLSWKSFRKIKNFEIYLPGDLKFNFTPGILAGDKNYRVMENRLESPEYFIDIAYIEEGKDFDIQSLTSMTNSGPVYPLKVHGYDSYYNSGYGEDGDLYYSLNMIGKNRKTYFSVSVIMAGNANPSEEQKLTAGRILFSARVLNSTGIIGDSASGQSAKTNLPYYIITGDDVRVRSQGSTNGEVLATFSKGKKVRLISRADAAVIIGGKKGRWAYIDAGSLKGWVFDYYMKEESVTAKTQSSQRNASGR